MRMLLSILIAIFIGEIQGVKLNETVVDFEDSLGIFNQMCQPGIAMFQRARYENYSIPRPDNISDVFLTAFRPGCIQTAIFDNSEMIELEFEMFRLGLNSSSMDVSFINAIGEYLSNETIELGRAVNWTKESVSYTPMEPFRIRLSYRTSAEGVFMAINSIAINLLEPPTQNFTGCIKDSFSDYSEGFKSYPCFQSNFNDFVRMQYSNTTIVQKPLGANDYFLTLAADGKPACMNYPYEIPVKNGTEVILTIYTDNEDGKTDWASLMAFDSMNKTIEILVIPIDNSRMWKRVSMTIKETVNINLRVFTQELLNVKAFLAIDTIGIKDVDSEDCTSNCQCSAARVTCSEDLEMYASTGEQGTTTGFGLTSIIISTTVVVSLLWGVAITAFVYRKKKILQKQENIINNNPSIETK